MSKARTLANFVSAGNPLADGTIDTTDINGVTVTPTEINYLSGVTSGLQSQLDNISVTSGTLTKSFIAGESSTITLSSTISPAPVVSVTKEVGQTGVSSKGTWDVRIDGANYEIEDSAYATTLTPTILGKWDVSSASYLQNFSVSAQDSAPQDIFFKPDGTKMYVVGSTGQDVNEYDLSTPWDVSSASYLQVFSLAAQEDAPTGIFFKPDGTKMYIVGITGQDVNEYDLSTPWDVSSASYLQNFSVSAQEATTSGIFFKPDGTKMYTVGFTGDDVNEYDLSTPWDVSSASYLQNFSVSAQETAPQGIFFKPDGTKMYIVGSTGDDINEYDVFSGYGVTLGSGSFAAGDVGKRITDGTAEVILADHTTGQYIPVVNFITFDTPIASGDWSMFAADFSSGGVTLSFFAEGIWEVSSASYLQNFSVATEEINPQGIFFKPDGTKMYVVGSTGQDVNEYDLSTPWDVSSASYLQNFSVSAQETVPTGIFFKPDGTKMYIVGSTGDDVNEYDLSTPWDVSSASYLQVFSVASQEDAPQGVFFKPDGTKMYIVGATGDDVNEYDLSTPWDVSSASYLQVFSVSAQDIAPTGIFFKPDGTKMYILGQIGDDVNEYDLSTPWDVSSASYLQVFSISAQETTPTGIFFKPDGAKMYIVGSTGDDVNEYDVGQIFYPDATYVPAVTNSAGKIDTTYWTDINTMTADQTLNDGSVFYAVSTDGRTTWSVIHNTNGVRDIVRDNAGTWEYNSNATYGSETWTSATTNTELAALSEALAQEAQNRMDKTQLDAVTDPNHYTLGNSLDLMIALYAPAGVDSIPVSDGVSINYDAAALNQGAVLGTDYNFDFPAGDKVRITSLNTQNLKVRVV